MRILITGANGEFGKHLVVSALKRFEFETFYTYFNHDPFGLDNGRFLNLTHKSLVHETIKSIQPDVVIHTAVSDRSMKAQQDIIEVAAENITAACKKEGVRLIHLSTDVLFGGDKAPYTENDPPDPLHAYGKAKAAAEAIVAQHDNHVIVRTSLIYSLEFIDRGIAWAVRDLKAGKEIGLFTNSWRNPIWIETLSAVCLELCAHSHRGVLHVAGSQDITRAEFARKFLTYWQAPNMHLATDKLSTSPTNPLDCRLDTTLAKKILQTPLPGVDDVLTS